MKIISKFPPVLWMLLSSFIVFSFLSPQFFALSNIHNILIQAAPLLIVSIGVTTVILSEGVDLSVGSIISLSSVLLVTFMLLGIPVYLAMFLALICCTLIGAINGAVVALGNVPPFIATLGMSSIASSIALVITQGSSIYFYHEIFSIIVNSEILFIPTPVVIAGIMFFITWVMLYKTRFGAQIFGLGGNREALILGGINKNLSIVRVFAHSGFLAGVTGIIIASRIESGNPIAGIGWEFDAVAASLIGGTSFKEGRGGIGGTVLGVLFLSTIRNALNVAGVSAIYQSALIGILVLLAIIIDVYLKNKDEEKVM